MSAVETSLKPGHPELQIVFDQERAAALNLNTADLATRVARAVQGSVATRYRLEDREIDVLVRGRETDRESVEAVRNLVMKQPGKHAAMNNLDDEHSKVNKFLRYYRQVAGFGTLDPALVTVV